MNVSMTFQYGERESLIYLFFLVSKRVIVARIQVAESNLSEDHNIQTGLKESPYGGICLLGIDSL